MYRILILNIIVGLSQASYSQSKLEKGYNIQMEIGYAMSAPRKAPVAFFVYFEGDEIVDQSGIADFQYNLSVYKSISPKSSLLVGLGFSNYSMNQVVKIRQIFDPGDYILIEDVLEFKFFNVSLGYRYNVFNIGRLTTFLESEMQYEYEYEMNYKDAEKNGLAIKFQCGAEYNLKENIGLVVMADYKTAITPYNKKKNFYPQSWGVSLGVNFKINSI